MNSADQVHRALQRRVDDRGYVRISIDDLVLMTGFSRSTVKRALEDLVTSGLIRRRSKEGRTGGLLIRLETGSQTGSQTGSKLVQNKPVCNALVVENVKASTGSASPVTGSPSTTGRTHSAWRPASPHEVPESGAELVYTGPEPDGNWKRMNATLWIAPNGDAVSIRNMTPELRLTLRVDQNEDGTPNLEAIKALRGTMDPYA
jgi:DNA-binding transcriptional MocR family regulator